jgi:hypothetical protein
MPHLVLERKSTAESIEAGSTYWKRLTLDPQISVYVEAGIAMGLDIRGCLYDVLRKPAHRPSEKKHESVDGFEKRVLDAIAAEPARYYARGVIVRLENERAEHGSDRWQTSQAIQTSRRLKVWPRNVDSCMSWSRLCEFFPICSGTARADDAVIFQKQPPHEELDGDKRDLVTQSSLRAYRSCPRKFFFRYEMGIRSVARAKPLRVGHSIHKALEVWSKTGSDLDAALATLFSEEEPHEAARQRAMVRGYHAMWTDQPLKIIAVEKEFRLPLVNPESGRSSRSFVLGGRVDGLVEAA